MSTAPKGGAAPRDTAIKLAKRVAIIAPPRRMPTRAGGSDLWAKILAERVAKALATSKGPYKRALSFISVFPNHP
jgi:hypothetical protein